MGGYLQGGVIQMVINASPMVKLVMAILLIFSVTCWAIIFTKYREFAAAAVESRQFLDLFWKSKSLASVYQESKGLRNSSLVHVFRAGYGELTKLSQLREGEGESLVGLDNLHRALGKTGRSEVSRLSGALGFLATAGNTAPFIGLFGTVWGIMNSFHGIGLTGSASLAAVAPGISEALIATAAGLATAIPAVAFYNYYLNRLRQVEDEMEGFSAELINLVRRDSLRRTKD